MLSVDRGGDDNPAVVALLLSSLFNTAASASSTREGLSSGTGWRARGVVSVSRSVEVEGDEKVVVMFDVVLGRVRVCCWVALVNRGYLRLWASSSDNRRSNWWSLT